MSDTVLVGVISAVVSLAGIIITTHSSNKDITAEIEKMNVKQSTDIEYIKKDIAEMKTTLREHNSYAAKFVEMQGQLNVVLNRTQVSEHRIADLEKMQIPMELKVKQLKDQIDDQYQ